MSIPTLFSELVKFGEIEFRLRQRKPNLSENDWRALIANGLLHESLEQRSKLLIDASGKPIRELFQFDGFHPDEIIRGKVKEFRRHGDHLPVRVHIWPSAEKTMVLRLLKEITDWIERDDAWLSEKGDQNEHNH